MSRKWRSKAGRPRKEGPRTPGGKLRPTDGPTPEALAHRTALGVPADRARVTGSALRVLHENGTLSWAEFQAGESLRAAWLRWRSLSGCPHRTARDRGGRGSDADPAWREFDDATRAYEERLAVALAGCAAHRLLLAYLDQLCFEDVLPARLLERSNLGLAHRAMVKAALAALAKHLRIADREAA